MIFEDKATKIQTIVNILSLPTRLAHFNDPNISHLMLYSEDRTMCKVVGLKYKGITFEYYKYFIRGDKNIVRRFAVCFNGVKYIAVKVDYTDTEVPEEFKRLHYYKSSEMTTKMLMETRHSSRVEADYDDANLMLNAHLFRYGCNRFILKNVHDKLILERDKNEKSFFSY